VEVLENEIKHYKAILADLRKTHLEGGFVVISENEVLGIWNERHDAMKEGIRKYGLKPFLVKNINDDFREAINFSRDLNFPDAITDY